MPPSRTAFAFVVIVALALAGCGKAASTTTGGAASGQTTTARPAASPELPPVRPIVAKTYTTTLGAFKRGSPTGSAVAAISVHPPKTLCWKFTQLAASAPPDRSATLPLHPR